MSLVAMLAAIVASPSYVAYRPTLICKENLASIQTAIRSRLPLHSFSANALPIQCEIVPTPGKEFSKVFVQPGKIRVIANRRSSLVRRVGLKINNKPLSGQL